MRVTERGGGGAATLLVNKLEGKQPASRPAHSLDGLCRTGGKPGLATAALGGTSGVTRTLNRQQTFEKEHNWEEEGGGGAWEASVS